MHHNIWDVTSSLEILETKDCNFYAVPRSNTSEKSFNPELGGKIACKSKG